MSSYLVSTAVTLEGHWCFIVFHHHPQFHGLKEIGVQFLAFKLGSNSCLFINCDDSDVPLFQQAVDL